MTHHPDASTSSHDLREAVALVESALRQAVIAGSLDDEPTDDIVDELTGPIATEFARLTGERDEANARTEQVWDRWMATRDRALAAEAELATLKADLSAAEARGRVAGLEEAAKVCDQSLYAWAAANKIRDDLAATPPEPPALDVADRTEGGR